MASELTESRFHWVNLQIHPILNKTFLASIQCALDSIPSDISGIVDSALRMIKQQEKNRANLANWALALLTTAQAPLTAEAMCHALGLGHILDYEQRPSELSAEFIPDSELIVECCVGLIKIEPMTRIMALAHYDILQEMQKDWANLFPPDYQAKLAKVCIAYLSLDEFSKGPCHTFDDFTNYLGKHPFLDYASRFWGYHARAALISENFKTDVEDGIHLFLKKPKNLGLSLQVSEYDPEDKQEKLTLDSCRLVEASELQIAARHGLTTVAKAILRTTPDKISATSLYGRTALHEATRAGYDDTVRMLIVAGADPSLTDDEGKIPFVYAAEGGHVGLISFLQGYPARCGQDPQALQEEHREILEATLYDAAEAGKMSVVEALLRLHVDPDAKKLGVSAMTAASSRGHERIVRLLLEHEASASYRDGLPSGRLPLHQAIRHGNVEIAALLLKSGDSMNTCDDSGRTALFETLNAPDITGAVLLLKKGINISCQDHRGDNVLHEAARRGATEHVSHFVWRVLEMDAPNKDGMTPLHLAAQYGHLDVATLLIETGTKRASRIVDRVIDIDLPNKDKSTSLHLAVQHEHPEVASLLIKNRASVDRRDARGLTPLIYAERTGNIQLMNLLLDAGATFDTVVRDQISPVFSTGETGYENFTIA